MNPLKMKPVYMIFATIFLVSACGGSVTEAPSPNTPLEPVGSPTSDGSVVHGRAIITVTNQQPTAMNKLFQKIFIAQAYAQSNSSTVTYTDADTTVFTVNTTSLGATGFTGTTLNLGKIALAAISDNNLEVCGTNGTTQCTTAVVRVYTTGSIAGFVNTAGSYGAPVYSGTTTPVGLTVANAVVLKSVNLPATKHAVIPTDFPAANYTITSDFSNAGAGSYSMTFVIEYALM